MKTSNIRYRLLTALGVSFHLLGVLAHAEAEDIAEKIRINRKGAEEGHPVAQYNLGYFYETGNGVPKDLKEAIKWYRMAAEQKLAPAQNNLGNCYQNGKGVPKNPAEAVKWYRNLPPNKVMLLRCITSGTVILTG